MSTLGGYLLSVWIGLFGFTEVRTTAGIVAGVIEVAAFAALAALAAVPAAPGQPAGHAASRSPLLARLQAGIPGAGRAIAGVCGRSPWCCWASASPERAARRRPRPAAA